MDILVRVFGNCIYIIIFTLIVSILLYIAEIIGYLIFTLCMKILKKNIGVKKIIKDYIFSLKFRLTVTLLVCIVLSLISIWNYSRIMSNPSHNSSIYIDGLGAIFANRFNEDNGLYSIYCFINPISLPFLYVLNIINTMIYIKYKKLISYVLFFLSGIFLAFMCYCWANVIMSV